MNIKYGKILQSRIDNFRSRQIIRNDEPQVKEKYMLVYPIDRSRPRFNFGYYNLKN